MCPPARIYVVICLVRRKSVDLLVRRNPANVSRSIFSMNLLASTALRSVGRPK
jgi:hypothetical protein